MDFPFSDAEQRFVLAEAIKTSSVPVDKLISFIDDAKVQPAWTQMLLPLGRNLKSCMDAWNALRPNAAQGYATSHPGPPRPPIPSGPPISSAPHKRKPPSEAVEFSAGGHPPKRRQSAEETTNSTQRVIQPKPSSNGQPPFLLPSPQPSQPKKRGRPSKAEVEARNADLIARGYVLPPPKTQTPRSKPPELAPREPEPVGHRETTFCSARPAMPPTTGARSAEGPASEPRISFDNRYIQTGPDERGASDQPGKDTRRPDPKQLSRDEETSRANPPTITGLQSQFSSFETRPPATPQPQILAPHPVERTDPITVESPLVPAAPTTETEANKTARVPS